MPTLEELEGLVQQGRVEDAHNRAAGLLGSPQAAERHIAALFLIFHNVYRHFGAALNALRPLVAHLENDFASCSAIAFAAWYTEDPELCSWAALRCIAIEPRNPAGYTRLGLLELSRKRYAHAFLAFSAARQEVPEFAKAAGWQPLARNLMQNRRTVRFEFDGFEFQFRLATHNGQFLEMACNHSLGHLYEAEELRLVRRLFGRCRAIVEVGALVGNHTIFFAKALQPERMHVFDANPTAIEEIRANLALNGLDAGHPAIQVQLAAIGAAGQRVQLFNQEVTTVALDEALRGAAVDMLKIDVDGMEMQVLDGCRTVIERCHPKIMIEVQKELDPAFQEFIQSFGYVIAGRIDRAGDTNYFITPPGNQGANPSGVSPG
jgi:FkbM family methyltransferase